MEFANDINEYLDTSRSLLGTIDVKNIDSAIRFLLDAYRSDSTVYILGNGGSATTAEHLACDFNKGLSFGLERRFNMVCLCDNIATVMAYANDCGYENVFVNQLQGRLKEGDVLICISGSGDSKNVIKAAEFAKERKNTVITMTGHSGGRLREISDCPIHVMINDQQKIEDSHLIIGHLIAQIIGKEIGHPMCL